MKYGITGISTPVGGISWSNNTTAKDRFKYLLLYLESKRILINPAYMELKEECIESVLEIKSQLVETTKDITFSEKDINIVRGLIRACNEYLNVVRAKEIPHLIYKDGERWAEASFDSAMKRFRSAFKDGIGQIEKAHKLKFTERIPDEY